MADRIVQLTDLNGDNLYPIASVPHGASITMTDTDPGEGSALAADNYIGVYGDNPIIMDYSTSEINTGFTWTDGSAIYKKTIVFGKAPNATTKNVAHGISNLGVVIKFEGFGFSSSSSKYTPIPWSPASSGSMMDLSVDDTNITMTSSSDRSAWSFTITLYYTKSS